jgi:hypothetical protein
MSVGGIGGPRIPDEPERVEEKLAQGATPEAAPEAAARGASELLGAMLPRGAWADPAAFGKVASLVRRALDEIEHTFDNWRSRFREQAPEPRLPTDLPPIMPMYGMAIPLPAPGGREPVAPEPPPVQPLYGMAVPLDRDPEPPRIQPMYGMAVPLDRDPEPPRIQPMYGMANPGIFHDLPSVAPMYGLAVPAGKLLERLRGDGG